MGPCCMNSVPASTSTGPAAGDAPAVPESGPSELHKSVSRPAAARIAIGRWSVDKPNVLPQPSC
jgi:hypothetical protein